MLQRVGRETTDMNKRSTKFYRKNEAEVMKRLGFRPTPNSGAGWISKEDGQNEQAICQLKSTDKQSISIKQTDLHILEQHALEAHKLPVFALQFLNLDEVWIMVKPEHIGLLQSFVRGEDISENLPRNIFGEEMKENAQNPIDNIEEKDYNNSVTNKGDIKSRLIAKRKYAEKVDKEREEREKEQKRRAKQWKQRLNKKE